MRQRFQTPAPERGEIYQAHAFVALDRLPAVAAVNGDVMMTASEAGTDLFHGRLESTVLRWDATRAQQYDAHYLESLQIRRSQESAASVEHELQTAEPLLLLQELTVIGHQDAVVDVG